MNKGLRNSGIDDIGKVFWGTHIGQIYSSIEDSFQIVAPYMLEGLKGNELCLWIYSQNTSYEEIKNVIGQLVDNIDTYIESGQLLLIPSTKWYLDDNNFNEIRVNSLWREYIQKALNQGFDGLRAAADTFWLEKSYYRSFKQYEQNINEMISELPFLVICLYDENKVDTIQIADIIKNHSHIIIKNENKLELIKNIELLIKDNQLNKTLEYDKIKTEFFANISHELKTPLNVILGTVQMLEMKNQLDINEKESKYLKIMKQNCFRLIRLINNLIDMTKIDADYYDLKKVNCDIVNLVEEITLSVTEYAINKGISIIFDTEIEEKIISCDPDQIERIVLNLLSNAIKFTKIGGKIFVSIYDLGENIKISVKDNGIGIPKDKQESIFNRFEQVDKSLTRQCEGSGIGLSLVKALVEKHGGKIDLHSEVGKGSEFIIEIPCEILNEKKSQPFNQLRPLIHDYVERIHIEFSDIYS